MPNLTPFDRILVELDSTLKTLFPPIKRASQRAFPDAELSENRLSMKQRKHTAGLMRVNHAGEVCAQALYQGQAMTAKLTDVKLQMNQAAQEETDHLAWCEQRLRELGSQPSVLNPIWYTGSLLMGALAGLAGDRVSLGFVAETERQVSAHLQKHLDKIPTTDEKTRAILQQMLTDEMQHAEDAKQAGGITLPVIVQKIMHLTSKLMTKTSYYL